jgi:esterase/lipase superfamily enzyme
MFDPIGVYAFRHSKAMIPIFYVTDRKTAPGVSPGSVIFTDDPSIPEGVSYGSGEIPIRWSRGDVFRNRDSEVSLSWKSDGDALQGLSSEEFYGRVASEAIGAEHGSAILFVHGFHNQFGQAVDTAAKLAYDLKFSGPIILYSWPSGGAVSSYDHDYENADWSVRHLQEVLQKLSAIVYKQNLNLIAHSMGARVLVKAIDLLRQPYQKYPLFNNIVLAAADIKDAEFSQGSDALRNSSRRITLYVSTWDGALLASSGLHKADRVGMEPVQRPGMDVVDTRGLDTSLLDFNHGYLFDSQPVLVDLFQIVHDDKGPNSRVGIRETRDGCCWAFEHR